MALYLGNGGKLKINLGGVVYCINLLSKPSTTNLLSSEGYILKDYNGIYLTVKES